MTIRQKQLKAAAAQAVKQAKRIAGSVATRVGQVAATARQEAKRVARRRRIQRAVRRAGAVLKTAGKAAVVAGVTIAAEELMRRAARRRHAPGQGEAHAP